MSSNAGNKSRNSKKGGIKNRRRNEKNLQYGYGEPSFQYGGVYGGTRPAVAPWEGGMVPGNMMMQGNNNNLGPFPPQNRNTYAQSAPSFPQPPSNSFMAALLSRAQSENRVLSSMNFSSRPSYMNSYPNVPTSSMDFAPRNYSYVNTVRERTYPRGNVPQRGNFRRNLRGKRITKGAQSSAREAPKKGAKKEPDSKIKMIEAKIQKRRLEAQKRRREEAEGRKQKDKVPTADAKDGKKDEASDESEANKKLKPEEDPKLRKDRFALPGREYRCYICNRKNFASKKTFSRHLKTPTHGEMADIFNAKHTAFLEFLKLSAELTASRKKQFTNQQGAEEKSVEITDEQKAHDEFSNSTCKMCDISFKDNVQLEEHTFSFRHLKGIYCHKYGLTMDESPVIPHCVIQPDRIEDAVKDNEKKSTVERFKAVTSDKIIEHSQLLFEAREKAQESPTLLKDLTLFDPRFPIGLEFIQEMMLYRCTVCDTGVIFKDFEEHTHSIAHYEQVVKFLSEKSHLGEHVGQGLKMESEATPATKEGAEDNSVDEVNKDESLEEMPNGAEYYDPLMETVDYCGDLLETEEGAGTTMETDTVETVEPVEPAEQEGNAEA